MWWASSVAEYVHDAPEYGFELEYKGFSVNRPHSSDALFSVCAFCPLPSRVVLSLLVRSSFFCVNSLLSPFFPPFPVVFLCALCAVGENEGKARRLRTAAQRHVLDDIAIRSDMRDARWEGLWSGIGHN